MSIFFSKEKKIKSYKIEKIQSSNYDMEEIPDEIIFIYSRDRKERFTLSVLKKQEEVEEDGILEFKEREIRANKAYIMEDIIKMIIFYEEGLQYNFIIEDDSLSIEEAIDIIEGMKAYN